MTQKHKRKIAPMTEFGNQEQAITASRAKAACLNAHLLGAGELAEKEWKAAGLVAPDLDAIRTWRLARVQAELQSADCAGALLYDPINIRYVTDSTNMQLWVSHNATRYCFVGNGGPIILFDYHHCEHLSDFSSMVDEVRPAISTKYFYSGQYTPHRVARWADQICQVLREFGAKNQRLAIDHIDSAQTIALKEQGIDIVSGEALMEEARLIKSPDEILCMRRAIHACEQAMAEMETALRPGISENELWAKLHHGNIVRGGEWIETRLLCSGPRTNPWFQESSARRIQEAELLAFDTDMIGPYGMCADISRTWLCGDGSPTQEQISLYRSAKAQIEHNTTLLKPGVSFRDLAAQAETPPDNCMANRYGCVFHGVGLCDEYPTIPYEQDWTVDTADGELVAGMVICVESYTGPLGGNEGVKLEEQVLVTESGPETLSAYPFDQRLMGN